MRFDWVFRLFAVNKAHRENLKARVQTLEDRIAALEARPRMRYAGTWSESAAYAASELVTHGGSMWIALDATKGRPGTDDS